MNKINVEKFGLKSGISSIKDTAGANCCSGDGDDEGGSDESKI